jgi:hypothetical protein
MGLAKKFLIAWIRGFQARQMYVRMKQEHEKKKLTKAQRAQNKEKKAKV